MFYSNCNTTILHRLEALQQGAGGEVTRERLEGFPPSEKDDRVSVLEEVFCTGRASAALAEVVNEPDGVDLKWNCRPSRSDQNNFFQCIFFAKCVNSFFSLGKVRRGRIIFKK